MISFVKAIGIVLLVSLCSFLENQANLTGLVNPIIATLIGAIASSIETHIKENGGNALFGTVAIK